VAEEGAKSMEQGITVIEDGVE